MNYEQGNDFSLTASGVKLESWIQLFNYLDYSIIRTIESVSAGALWYMCVHNIHNEV